MNDRQLTRVAALRSASDIPQDEAAPPQMGLIASTSIFGAFSILLWLTVAALVRWLRDAFGILLVHKRYRACTCPHPVLWLCDGVARAAKTRSGCIEKTP